MYRCVKQKKRESIFQKLTHVNFKNINRVKNNTSIYILNRYNFIVYTSKKITLFLEKNKKSYYLYIKDNGLRTTDYGLVSKFSLSIIINKKPLKL